MGLFQNRQTVFVPTKLLNSVMAQKRLFRRRALTIAFHDDLGHTLIMDVCVDIMQRRFLPLLKYIGGIGSYESEVKECLYRKCNETKESWTFDDL